MDIVASLEANEQRRTTVTETIVAPPSPRSNFSFCSHPDKEELILFGGEYFNGQTLSVYNELYFYNIPKNEWKLVMAPGGPGPRSAHQMVSVASDGGQLWVRDEVFFCLVIVRKKMVKEAEVKFCNTSKCSLKCSNLKIVLLIEFLVCFSFHLAFWW